jgi:hypothetical protein
VTISFRVIPLSSCLSPAEPPEVNLGACPQIINNTLLAGFLCGRSAPVLFKFHRNLNSTFQIVDLLRRLGHLDLGHRAVQERRTIFRKRVLKTAQIVLSEKAPKLDCAIRNVSDIGACLQVSTTYGIPVNFDVTIEGVRRPCRSIWRTDTKIGIMFR